jgi:peptidoglycan/xylan/chitin deacetylase (PgdA/CDA1 family)
MTPYKEFTMYIVSLSFDDGFEKSNLRIAEIYEKYGLSACFNVMALADGLVSDTTSHIYDLDAMPGNFILWNELQARGHEVMPHGLVHHNLTEIPFTEAQRSVLRCLDIFEWNLKGFHRHQAIYNFAFNAHTPTLQSWLLTQVRAVRLRGSDGINPLPAPGARTMTTTGYGPDNCEAHLEVTLEKLFSQPEGWLVYNTHGIDGEGWGPIRSSYLEELLVRLLDQNVLVMPVGQALDWANQRK